MACIVVHRCLVKTSVCAHSSGATVARWSLEAVDDESCLVWSVRRAFGCRSSIASAGPYLYLYH